MTNFLRSHRSRVGFEQVFAGLGLAWVIGTILAVSGWVTHVVYTIQHRNDLPIGDLLLCIGGIFAAPLGAIHGFGLWFGWWG